MELLPYHDLLALNCVIGEICSARDMTSFHSALFTSIWKVIPYELCSFNEVGLAPVRFLKITSSSQDRNDIIKKLLPVSNEYLHEHPLFSHFTSEAVFKTTDFVSQSQFKTTNLYNEYYRHLDTETQIGFSIPISPEKSFLLILSRNSNDFSERDRLLLAMLKPHFINALRNVTDFGRVTLERDLLQRGVEAERQGAILLQSDGKIMCISALAKEICGKYFHADLAEGDPLPGTLLAWFNTEINSFREMRASTKFSMRVERAPFVVEKAGKNLKVKLFHDLGTGEYILFIVESDPSLLLQNMLGYGLSIRETEVLQWLSQGKTNGEIAAILSMSKRTADKHLERIFAKLGVGTRAAAAAIIRKELSLI